MLDPRRYLRRGVIAPNRIERLVQRVAWVEFSPQVRHGVFLDPLPPHGHRAGPTARRVARARGVVESARSRLVCPRSATLLHTSYLAGRTESTLHGTAMRVSA